jgi:hypothetical protein
MPNMFVLIINFTLQGFAHRIVASQRHGKDRRFSYPEFVAHQMLLTHLPSMLTTVNLACEAKRGAISKDDLKMARSLLGSKMSRMEADTVFDIFDLDRVSGTPSYLPSR